MSIVPAISTRSLTKRFGDVLAVDHLDLEVAPGAFFGFLGPNGAGKSTTVNMLTGLLRPTSGEALVLGRSITEDPVGVKTLIGVVAERTGLYEYLTGREYLWFVGRVYGLPDDLIAHRSDELLELLDLTDKAGTLIRDYSHGMQKKIALSAALIHDPRALFLDEPFEGVDVVSASAIRDVLLALASRGTTIFFSSHILEIVEKLCSEMAIINQGRLIARGTLDQLRARAAEEKDSGLEDIFLRIIGAREREMLSWIR